MISSFTEKAAALEAEGVYIGGWSAKNVLSPRKDTHGEYGKSLRTLLQCSLTDQSSDTSEDRIERLTTARSDWTDAEERRLVRKLDARVVFPSCRFPSTVL